MGTLFLLDEVQILPAPYKWFEINISLLNLTSEAARLSPWQSAALQAVRQCARPTFPLTRCRQQITHIEQRDIQRHLTRTTD